MEKREAKKLVSQGLRLFRAIEKEYNKINPDSEYHDALYYQMNGAIVDHDEMEYEYEQGDFEHMESCIKNLQDCLKACKLANKIEDMKSKVKFIYG